MARRANLAGVLPQRLLKTNIVRARASAGCDSRAVRHLPPPRGVHRLPPADAAGRDHPPADAVIEQINADLKAGPLAHLPSGKYAANSAWLVLAAIAFNLARTAGALASQFHARATTATIRTRLIAVPTQIPRSARGLRMHLPRDWPWEHALTQLFDATCGPAAAV